MSVLLAASPPLGTDDVRGFRRELEQDDWFLRLQELDTSMAAATSGRGKRRIRTTAKRALAALGSDMGSRHRMLSS